MSARDLLLFALAALRGHRLRTALSLLGVTIGVVAVILLTSLGQGARLYVSGEFTRLGTNLLMVFPGKTETTGMAPILGGAPRDLTLEDAEILARRVRRVRGVAPVAAGAATARARGRNREVWVVGSTHAIQEIRHIRMQSGVFLPPGEAAVCVLGSKVRQELFGSENPLGQTLRLGEDRFRITGVAVPRGISIGRDFDEMVYVPVSRALKMFNRTSLFQILLETNSHRDLDPARREVLAVLRERHGGEEDVTVLTQDSVNATFGRILSMLTLALGGIAAVSLAVAGIGIMNVMLVSVSERTREVGLLKALGVTPRQVLAVFLTEAALLSSAGGLLGLATSFLALRLFRLLYPSFPAEPPDWAVAGAMAVSILLGMIFGAMPARRAARLDPVAALARR